MSENNLVTLKKNTSFDEDEEIKKLEAQIHLNVMETIHLIVGKCTTEFLRVNLYEFVRNKMAERRFWLEGFESENIESRVREDMLKPDVLKDLVKQAAEIYGVEVLLLQKTVLAETEKRFYRMFVSLDRAKSKFENGNHITPLIEFNSSRKNLYQTLSETDVSQQDEKSPKPSSKSGPFRFFRHFLLMRIFFPALIYRADMPNPSRKDRISFRDALALDGTPPNKTIKSMAGLLCALVLTWLIYIYMRYQIQVESFKAATTLCLVFGLLLVGLVSNWPKFRCIVLLTLPYMASSRGRAILLMNCVSLTSTIVLPNMMANFEQIEQSLVCNREIVRIPDLFLFVYSFRQIESIYGAQYERIP